MSDIVSKKIIITYSHSDNLSSDPDEKWLDRLLQQFEPLSLAPGVCVWSDRDVEPGELWQTTIEDHLRTAVVAILLVSPAYLASDFIRNVELPLLLSRWRERRLKIVPILLRHSVFDRVVVRFPHPQHGPDSIRLSDLQAVPGTAYPLSTLEKDQQDEMLVHITKYLERLLSSDAEIAPPSIRDLSVVQQNRYPDISETPEEYLGLIYGCYEKSDAGADIFTCTSSWPIDASRRRCLVDLKADTVTFLGPIGTGQQFLGVLWRLGIDQERAKTPRFEFRHRGQSGLKFVVVGSDVVISDSRDETPSGHGKRWVDFPALAEVLRDFARQQLRSKHTQLLRKRVLEMLDHQLVDLSALILEDRVMLSRLTGGLSPSSFPAPEQLPVFVKYLQTILPGSRLDIVKDYNDGYCILRSGGRRGQASRLPAIRIAIAPSCDFECVYCPRSNESYPDLHEPLGGRF